MTAPADPPLAPPVFSVGEAVDRLQTPAAIEDLASLHNAVCLIVDFDRTGVDGARAATSGSAIERARKVLPQLACPTLALARTPPGRSLAPLLARFDLVIEREEDLPPLVAACQSRPLAALALVQLLRLSESLDTHEGLVAESLVYSTLQAGPEFAAWLAARRPRAPKPACQEPAVRVIRESVGDSGSRLRLSLNRPAKRNAFSLEMRDALVEGLHVAIADPGLCEIVLEGCGAAFCSGGDLDEFGSLPDPATAHAIRATRNAARLLAECSDRLHARVHGACIGAGVELPAFARRLVATPDAFFQLPEIRLGLVPGSGGTVSIPRRIGRQRTAWMALTGARVDAPTALRWGLVDELCERGDASADRRGGG